MTFVLNQKEIIDVGYKAVESIKTLPAVQGNKFLLASRDKKVCVVKLSSDYTVPSRVVESYEDSYSKRFTDVEYSPAGDKIIAVSAANEVTIWDRTTKKSVKFSGHTRNITSVTLNAKNNKIVTGSEDYGFILWNIHGEKIATFDRSIEHSHKSWVNDLGFVPNSDDVLVTASEDGTVKIWDLEKPVLLKTFFNGALVDYEKAKETKVPVKDFDFDMAIKAIAFSKDGSLLAYGGRNCKVYLLNLSDNEFLTSIDVPDKVFALAFGENQPLIAISIPNKILLWNIIESKFVGEFVFAVKGEKYCRSLVFVGDEILAGLEDGKVARIEVSRK
jgi:WD40 repeat protein